MKIDASVSCTSWVKTTVAVREMCSRKQRRRARTLADKCEEAVSIPSDDVRGVAQTFHHGRREVTPTALVLVGRPRR